MSKSHFPYEFSWKHTLFHGKYILPEVRHQGFRPTCLFHAMCSAAEIEMARTAALKFPPEDMNTRFLVDSFVKDYERKAESPVGMDQCDDRVTTAIKVFKRGIVAKGDTGYQWIKISDVGGVGSFEEACGLIQQGRPVLGNIWMSDNFDRLSPVEIYRYQRDLQPPEESHAVVFVGYGEYLGEKYFVFLNSHGETYGDRGFGRVFFDSVCGMMTLRVPFPDPFRGP